jgi:hypothetical protein
MKIISVHVPKAGGTSLSKALARAFGEQFSEEYNEDPADPRSPRNIDPERYFTKERLLPENVRCLHGHFHPGQFNLENVFLFTLLRHPVENIISIFSFWKTLPSQGNPLHDYFLSQRLDIIEMARLPLLRRLYSQTYFGSFDMSRFNLVGRHENRDSACLELERATGVSIDSSLYLNLTPATEERARLMADASIMGALHQILEDDVRFYDRFSR